MTEALPHGWTTARLADVVDILDSRRVPVNATERASRAGSVPYYGATGQVGLIDDHIFDEDLVLLGEDGAPFLDAAKPKAYAIHGRTWVNNHAHVLRGRTGVLNAFVMHQLNSIDFHPFVSGTTRLKLPQGPMNEIPIRLAATNEQRRIVETLETHFTRLDAAVATLERVRANTRRYRAAALGRSAEGAGTSDSGSLDACPAGVDELIDEMEGMRTGPFGTLLSKAEHREQGVPVLGIENIDELRFVPGSKIHVSPAKAEQLRAYRVAEGDLLVTRSGTVGQVCAVPASAAGALISTNTIRLRFKRPHPVGAFVALQLAASFKVRAQIHELCKGSTRDFLNQRILSQLRFRLPPEPQQVAVLDEAGRIMTQVDHLDEVMAHTRQRCARLRQSLLRLAFDGRLVPQDSRDEPASALLERIRRERAAKAPSSKQQPLRRHA